MLNSLMILVLASEGGSLIDVNPGLIFWQAITFILLLLILKRLAWKPILSALSQRENAIKEAQKILQKNQASIANAEEESKKIIEQSRNYADKLKDQMLKESKEQARKIIEDASSEIERKKEETFNELKTKVAEIAIQAAEKILDENLNKDSNKKLVDKYLDKISRN